MHRQVKDKTDEEKAKEFEEYFGCQAISVESVEDRRLLCELFWSHVLQTRRRPPFGVAFFLLGFGSDTPTNTARQKRKRRLS